MAAAIQVPAVFTAVDKFTGVVSRMSSGIKSFSKSGAAAINRVNTRLNNTIQGLGKFGMLLGGLTIGTLFSEAIQGNLAFNDSLASVSAITGETGKDLAKLETLAIQTAKSTNNLGSDVLKAYELVGSAQPILLENADSLDKVTRSVITLSQASRMDLEQSTRALTDVMNQFNLTSEDSAKTIDVLAAGAKFGAAAIPQISESIVQFGTVAKQSNVSLLESVAAVEIFASKGVKGAEAGTKLRNVLTTLATARALPKEAQTQLAKFGVNLDVVSNKSLPLAQRLQELSKIGNDATAMVKVFGKENQGAGAILLNNIPAFEKMLANVNENGVAVTQASAQTNTFVQLLKNIKTAFINTTTATNSNNKSLNMIKEVLRLVADNMGTVVTVIASVLAGFVAFKAVVGIINAVAIAQGIYTSVMSTYSAVAVTAALTGSSFAAVIWATVAPILAVVAAIGAVVAIIYYWDEITAWFGKQWGKFTSFIGSAWQSVIGWFQSFDFTSYFKNIGMSILNFLLFPLKAVLLLLSKIPGSVGEFAGGALESINEFTGTGTNSAELLPSTTAVTNTQINENITNRNSTLDINIKDRGNNVSDVKQSGDVDIPVRISNTIATGM